MELQDFTSPALARMVGLAFGTVPGTDQERMLAKRDVQGLIGLGVLTDVPRAGQRVLLGRDVAQPRACADAYLTHRRQVAQQPAARTLPAQQARTVPRAEPRVDYSGAGAPRPAETASAADVFRASLAGLRVRRR